MQFIEDLKKRATWWPTWATWWAPAPAARSATNSVIWATGQDIPFVPNKRFGGVTLGGKIAPIFFNTQEDSGALPIEVDVTKLQHGRRDRRLPLRRQDREKDGAVAASSSSRATCCSTKCAPAAAST
jgi:aconitate hydratase 2/2-methylisocitrate dehydratase